MDWGAIAAIAEAVGASAVLITLVYLAQQVRQARYEQQAAAVRASRTERRQYFEALRDSPYIPAILCKMNEGEPLTAEEERRLLSHHSALWGLIYSEWVQTRLSILGEYRTSLDFNLELLATDPRVRDWFERFGRRLYPDAFVSDVERVWHELDAS